MVFESFLSSDEIVGMQLAETASDKEQKRTPEQIEAIYTHGQNVLVSASAGSGKTFVMVQRILEKLKRGISVNQLFISTFTVKAAGELKERIEKNLLEMIAQTTDQELRLHLSAQLADLATADIGTMDAFTQKLVTTYGYSLGLSPQFRILQDETEKLTLKQEVFNTLFSHYMDHDSSGNFRQLVRNFSGNRKDNSGFRDLVYRIYDFSQSTSHPTEWLKNKAVQADLYSSAAIEKQLGQEFRQVVLGKLTAVGEFFRYHIEWGKKDFGAAKYFTNVEMVCSLLSDLEQLNLEQLAERVEQVLMINDQSRGKGLTNANRPKDEHLIAFKEEYNSKKNELISDVRAIRQEIYELTILKDYQSQALPLLEILRDFVLDFSQAYLAVKIKESTFEFGDIGHFAIRILEENSDIRHYFQENYHEVMVDEYQDTNHSQERMLDLLSNGQNRFMVGDIKQSIYRFRQADPMIFQEKFDTYQANPAAGKLILLKENFRSQIEVLDATNAIFTRLMDRQIGEINYDETHCLVAGSARQKIAQPKHEMEYLIYDNEQVESETSEQEEQLMLGEVEVVAKEIIRLHNEEGVQFKDITLLVQKRTQNDFIQSIFDKYGIPLVADGGSGSYLQSLEVMVMLDTLRVINHPLNDYALVALLKSPMFQFDEDELTRLSLQARTGFFYQKMELAQAGQGDHPELIGKRLHKKLSDFLNIVSDWRFFAKLHSIYELIWKIFNEKFYYDYVAALPNGSKRQANLYALGLRANQFEKTGYKGLARFIAMIDRTLAHEKDLVDVQEFLPQDAVQLMTIHKSKGLEFQYVFLMNIDKRFNLEDQHQSVIISRKNGLGIQYLADMKDRVNSPLPHVNVLMNTLPYQQNLQELKLANLSEQMRLLYVALTRAEKKIYLVGKGSAAKLADRYDGLKENGVLATASREKMFSFQDWILAIDTAFSGEKLYFKKVFVTDDDLTPEKIGTIRLKHKLEGIQLKDVRQSEVIKEALDQLSSVQALNLKYKAASELPSLRTPSQIKKLYEPVLDQEGMEVMETFKPRLTFELPNFSKKVKVSGVQVGSAVHELMQRLDLSWVVTEDTVRQALQLVHAEQEVKDSISVSKILDFFDTALGSEILANTDKLHREAPFASLQLDSSSNERFVLRGIIDGYLLYDDHIVLFDYKTDSYHHVHQLQERYNNQMKLYAQALKKAYRIDRVDAYLILLGGEKIEVVSVDIT